MMMMGNKINALRNTVACIHNINTNNHMESCSSINQREFERYIHIIVGH